MTALETANTGDFGDAYKCELLKSKMVGKYAPVPANDPYKLAILLLIHQHHCVHF